jgi:hypothetical protein
VVLAKAGPRLAGAHPPPPRFWTVSFLEEPDTGPDTPAETSKRRTRGVDPLSTSHRRRLLAALNRAAENGDVAAQQALVELSISAELDKAIAAAIEQAKGEGEGEG